MASGVRTRKRKAQEADIGFDVINEYKRLKTCNISDPDAVLSSNEMKRSREDDDASFSHREQSLSSSIDHEFAADSQEANLSKNCVEINDEKSQSQSEAAASFDDLGAFHSFSAEHCDNHNTAAQEPSSSEFAWGSNSNDNDFQFDSNTSQFSLSEFTSASKQTSHAQNDEEQTDLNGNHNDGAFGDEQKQKAQDQAAAVAAVQEEEPVALLTGMVDAGDKEDTTVYEMKCKVWQFEVNDGGWHEKGVGNVKINTYYSNDGEAEKLNARILCRKDVTLKTLINGVFSKDTPFTKQNAHNIKCSVLEQERNEADQEDDDVEEQEEEFVVVPKTYCLRIKETDKSKIDTFLEKIKQIQAMMD